MLCKLSFHNVRRSVRDYAVYFFTLVVGVAVFYVFNAIGDQMSFMRLEGDTRQVARVLVDMIGMISVFVSVVLGLLIVYASRFLMKRRGREFALYMLMGMGKGKITLLLVAETAIIGLMSLLVGLPLGMGMSQAMSAVVANLFEADMTDYRFIVSAGAVQKTIWNFALIYLVAMLLGGVIVSRMKLIDLIHTGSRSERSRLTSLPLCALVFLAAAGLLGYAYYQVGWNFRTLTTQKIARYVAMGSVGTLLFFWSVSGMLTRLMMALKGVYYRGVNAFTFRQVASRVHTMVWSMTVICLMLFVTICAMCSAFSMRDSLKRNLDAMCPADVQLDAYAAWKDGETAGILDVCRDMEMDITEDLTEWVVLKRYETDSVHFMLDGKETDMPLYGQGKVVRLSDYNRLMALYQRPPLAVRDGEYALTCDYRSVAPVYDDMIRRGLTVEAGGRTLTSCAPGSVEGFVSLGAQRLNMGLLVLPDSALEGEKPKGETLIGRYRADARQEKRATDEKIYAVYDAMYRCLGEKGDGSLFLILNTRSSIADDATGLGAIATFLGLYIGMVFLIACGALLALKALSDCVDSAGRYEVLRKIGADEGTLSRSLMAQTGVFFLLPLLVALLHSFFGMRFALQVLEVVGAEVMGWSLVTTGLILLAVYGGYFLLTYTTSRRILRERMP